MGKSKSQKSTGSKPKQQMNTTSVLTEITEPKPSEEKSETTAGNKKLLRQLEREVKEEEERKRIAEAAAEKARQEAKNNAAKKKTNKKTPPRAQKVSEPALQPKPEVVKEAPTPQINKNSSGNWNTEPTNTKDEVKHIQNTNETDNMETDNSYQDSPPKQHSVKLNRDFGNYTSSFESEKQAWGDQSYNANNSWPDNQNESTASSFDNQSNSWRGGDNRNFRKSYGDQRSPLNQNRDSWNSNPKQRLSDPNHRKQDSYSNFANRSFGSEGSFKRYSGYQYEGGKHDKDYQEFVEMCKKKTEINYGKVREIKGDLFTASEEYSLAHCVAEDMAMGAGIAKTFRSQFGQVGNLLNQNQNTGGLAVLQDEARFIYYLVTKEQSRGKPTYYTLWQSLTRLKDHMQRNNVTKLALPQIGCGLDRLDWYRVRQMLEHIFRDAEVEIVVYIWDESAIDDTTTTTTVKKILKKCAVIHEQMDILDIQTETGLLYFGTVDGHESNEFKHLATKYNMINTTYRQKKELPDVLKTVDRKEYIYGLIIRNTITEKINFTVVENALKKLKKMLYADKTVYVGFQAFVDKNDKYLQDKIIALMQYIFLDVEIWVCWPKELEEFRPQQRKSFY